MSLCRPVFVAVLFAGLAFAACSENRDKAKLEFVRRGDALVAQHKYREAIIEYRNATQRDARFGEARQKLADAYLKIGDPASAYQEIIRAADVMPDNVDAQVRAGVMDLGARRFDDARARADRALALKPTSVEARVLRGNALAGLKDLDAAISEIEEAIKADPDRTLTYQDLAGLQLAKGDSAKAEEAFKQAVSLAPKSVPPLLALANFYWASGKRDLTEQTLKKALALEPRNVQANRALAYLYVSIGRTQDAEAPLKFVAENTGDISARLILAEYYRLTGREPLAFQVLDGLMGVPAAQVLAKSRKSLMLYSDGRKPEAYALIQTVLDKDANNGLALLTKAAFLSGDRDFGQALTLAQASVKDDPVSVGARYMVGRIETEQGNFDDAVNAFNEALRLAPRFAPALVELSRLSLLNDQPADTVHFADEALAIKPGSVEPLLLKVRALMVQGNTTAAEAPLRALAAAFPDSPVIQAQLGTFYLQKHDPRSARAAYERALKMRPDDVQALTGLMSIDFSEKAGERARARIEAAVAQHPDAAPLLLVAAQTYGSLGDMAKAESTLRRAVQVDPSNLDALMLLGRLFASQHRLDEAIAEFKAIADRKPKSVGPPTQVGMFFELESKRPEAVRWYERALAIDSRAPVAANNLAMFYVDTGGNLDTALKLAQTAKSQLPDQPEVNDTLGWIYVRKKLGSLALPPLLQAVTEDPSNSGYLAHLGVAYMQAGQADRAREALRKALAHGANFPDAKEAQAVLARLTSKASN